ncbi:MAG: PPC domain-containing protein, partial [Planctomycetaceae bacterium]
MGASLGSPLETRLEVRDPAGHPVAESSANPLPGSDASVRFTAAVGGTYSVRIHDLKFGGLQHYVYRLTITRGPHIDRVFPLGGRQGTEVAFTLAGQQVPAGPQSLTLPGTTGRHDARFALPGGPANLVALEVDEWPELVEDSTRAEVAAASTVQSPGFIANGRIARPGEVDVWPVLLKKGETVDLEVRAGRLGSPLDSVLTVVDDTGKELAQNDDVGGAVSDSRLSFAAPADGTFLVRVAERDPDRAGEAFAYRLRVTPPATPDFRLVLPTDVVAVARKGEAKYKLKVEALGGFAGEVALKIEGLPAGVTVAPEP